MQPPRSQFVDTQFSLFPYQKLTSFPQPNKSIVLAKPKKLPNKPESYLPYTPSPFTPPQAIPLPTVLLESESEV